MHSVYHNIFLRNSSTGLFIFQKCIYLILFNHLLACEYEKTSSEKNTFRTIQYTDDYGNKVTLKKNVSRVLSLSPSVTEILCAVCDTSVIIGKTPYCNYPTYIKSKPTVSSYPINREQILALRPDVVFVKKDMFSESDLKELNRLDIPVYSMRFDGIEDVLRNIVVIGEITGYKKKSQTLCDSLRAEIEKLKSLPCTHKPSVLLLISKSELYAFGYKSYATELIDVACAKQAVDSTFAEAFPRLTQEYILKINPDVIIGGKHVGLETDFFVLYPALKRTKAFINKKIFSMDEDLLSRPGPRIAETIITIRKFIK
ncbi:MAG: helical backbone metal receptor [Cytophagaceae bacterium]|nr:helical backbone metal receptor [Cytophagaceae bacterium]MDW8455652.1 helical backbone metal receptor [Cytophagaceae bacterium]